LKGFIELKDLNGITIILAKEEGFVKLLKLSQNFPQDDSDRISFMLKRQD
jgi:hypothetical protein